MSIRPPRLRGKSRYRRDAVPGCRRTGGKSLGKSRRRDRQAAIGGLPTCGGRLVWFGLITLSYFIGGISAAYLATRLLTGQDVRQLGDRNPGAANVFRNVNPKAGLLVGAVDVLKGRWLWRWLEVWLTRRCWSCWPGPRFWPVTTGRCIWGFAGAGGRHGHRRIACHFAGVGGPAGCHFHGHTVRDKESNHTDRRLPYSGCRTGLACGLSLSGGDLRGGRAGLGGLDPLLQRPCFALTRAGDRRAAAKRRTDVASRLAGL